jgi:hypothetical protein
MRLIFGMIIGCALTLGAAYVADAKSPNKPMVNWDVVAERWDTVTTLAQDGWNKIFSDRK